MNKVKKRESNEKDLKFFKTINHENLLRVEDEVELVKQIRQGESNADAAKEMLMTANQRFVYVVAKQYVSEKFSLEELMAEGNIGLEHAIYKFDETRGFKFISYAVWWIRQSIINAIVMNAKEEGEQKELSHRELDILRMYYGLGREKASLEDIQAKYGLSRQRVMAFKDKALRKLFKSKEKLCAVRAVLLGETK